MPGLHSEVSKCPRLTNWILKWRHVDQVFYLYNCIMYERKMSRCSSNGFAAISVRLTVMQGSLAGGCHQENNRHPSIQTWWYDLSLLQPKGFLYFWINLFASTFNSDESLSSTGDLTHHNKQRKLLERESETKSELNNPTTTFGNSAMDSKPKTSCQSCLLPH